MPKNSMRDRQKAAIAWTQHEKARLKWKDVKLHERFLGVSKITGMQEVRPMRECPDEAGAFCRDLESGFRRGQIMNIPGLTG